MGLAQNLLAFVCGQSQEAFDSASDRLTRTQSVSPLRVELNAPGCRGDRHFLADGQDQLFAKVEPATLFRVLLFI